MGLSRMDYQEARATMDTGHRTKTNLSFYTRNVGFLIARMRWYKYEFEDTKEVIRIRKSKDVQPNGQKKKDKRINNDLQTLHIKLTIE